VCAALHALIVDPGRGPAPSLEPWNLAYSRYGLAGDHDCHGIGRLSSSRRRIRVVRVVGSVRVVGAVRVVGVNGWGILMMETHLFYRVDTKGRWRHPIY